MTGPVAGSAATAGVPTSNKTRKNILVVKRMVVHLPIGQDVLVPPGLKVIADSQLISRTGNRYAGAIQHVSINHGRGHVSMPQQFLHCPNIIAGLE